MKPMNNFTELFISFVSGMLLGLIFFAGLWWTLKISLSSRYVAFWLLGSMMLRAGLVLVGFYYVGGSSWQKMASCLVGFFITRVLFSRSVQKSKKVLWT